MQPKVMNGPAALVIAALLVMCGSAQLPSYAAQREPVAPSNEKGAGPSKEGTDRNPADARPLPSKSDVAKTEKEDRHRENEARVAIATEDLVKKTEYLVGVTAILAIFTALLFGATVILARDGKRTSDRQATETKRSLELSEAASNAAKKSADAAVNVAIPYLFPVIPASFVEELKRNARPTLTFEFENYGSTPAILRRFVVTLQFVREVPKLPDFTPGDLRSKIREIVIPPKGAASYSWPMEETIIPYEDLREEVYRPGGRRIWFLGRAEYDDFFGNLHIKTFAIKLFPIDDGRLRVLVSGGIEYNNRETKVSPYSKV